MKNTKKVLKNSHIKIRVSSLEKEQIKKNSGGNVSKYLIDLGMKKENKISRKVVVQDPELVHQARRIGISLNNIVREINIRKKSDSDIDFIDLETQLVIANQHLSDLVRLKNAS